MTGQGPRIFSIEEANALVPQLSDLVADQLELAEEIQQLVMDLGSHPRVQSSVVTQQLSGQHGVAEFLDITTRPDDDIEVRAMKRKLTIVIRRYRRGWQEVEGLGVVVKDRAAGLLDLYGRIDDRLVCLCWRFGEHAVDHYHEVHDSFDERKLLAPDQRKRLLN